MSILSSQHQGSLFIVVLHVSHTSAPTPANNEPLSTISAHLNNNVLTGSTNLNQLCVISHPIRIVSKVDHVKKEGIPILKKKTFHEILTDKLKRLQKCQDGQSKWIKNLFDQHHCQFDYRPFIDPECNNNSSNNNNSNNSNHSTPQQHFINHLNSEDDEDQIEKDNENDDDQDDDDNCNNNNNIDEANINQIKQQQKVVNPTTILNGEIYFQNSFNRVVESYKCIVSIDDRKEEIKKMVKILHSEDLEQLVNVFIEELHDKEIPHVQQQHQQQSTTSSHYHQLYPPIHPNHHPHHMHQQHQQYNQQEISQNFLINSNPLASPNLNHHMIMIDPRHNDSSSSLFYSQFN
ncbi:putative transcriptional regulator [Cavenderia fasciculata]|uniref:Transcriptional regulator n=1 Tax=Cavenderia fasciculata TaxID=261658 RepID=F4PX40_CACFS|nr:putative transcriptional regulator [Cavenderia fasciculata]EGG19843.1 putative transcriptional regulator [Cavenderia fasciculata]|eukprot:XP_004358189.1 putative transcriptional regulator [Cavenderia fasciculata]